MTLDSPVTAPYPIMIAEGFINAAIPKLEELSLEYRMAQWNDDILGPTYLLIEVFDTIANEDVQITIPQTRVFSWLAAHTTRAANYIMDLAIQDGVESSSTKPSQSPYTDDEWADIVYGYEYEDYSFSF